MTQLLPGEGDEVNVRGEPGPGAVLGQLPEDVHAALGRRQVHEEVVGQAPGPEHSRVDHVNPDIRKVKFRNLFRKCSLKVD